MIARLLSTACCLLACVTAPALEWTLAESQIDVVSDPHAWRPIPVTVVLSEPAPEGLTLVSPWGAYAQAYIDRTGVQIAMASPIPGEEPAIFGAIAIPAGALTFSCVLPGVSIGPDASLEPDWSTDLELSVSGQGTRRLAVRVRNAARGPTVAIAPVPPAPYGTNAVLATTIDDPAGAGTTMAWAQVGGPAVDLSGVQGPAPLVALPAVGTYVFRGTATDANGRSASSDITVTRTRPRIVVGGSLPLAAAVVDQFGALIPETAYTWTVSGGGSVVDGIFTPGDQPGLRQISVSAPGVPQADTLAVQVAGIPALAWSTPAPLPVGGTLDAVRLAATSSVPGTFTYTPPAGTVLGSAGTVPLRADFTPADADAWEGGTVTTTLTVQDGQGGGDDPQPGPSVPSVTLSVTAGLTGDPAATIDGQATVFTNNKVISVTVSATSTGTIGSVVLSTSDGRSWPLSNGGVEEIPVATEGRLELSASATAERNGQTATGTAAPLVVVVDHTPPRVSWEIAAAATGGAAEPLPSGLIWLGGGTAEDALKTRTTYGVVCYPKAGFALHGTIEELSGLSGRHDAGHEVAFVSHNGTRTAQVVPATAQQIVVPVPADAVDQATPDPATLLLQIEGDARFEAKLTDRAGNTAAASIATVRIKSKPPLAAVGGLALTPSDGEETVINLDGWTSYTPMQTVVTSCDVIAVEQSGKHAVRLSNGPAMLGHGGHRRIAWLLPQPVGVSIGAETPLSLELTDLAGQSQEWTTAAKLRAHRQMSFPDQSLSFEERAVVAVDYNEVYDVMSILISFGFPERIWERRMSLPPWDIAIITGAGAADFSNSFEIPGKIGHVVRAFQPLDEPPAELPIENSAFMAFLADDDYDCDDQCIAPRAVDPQEWAQTKVGIIQRFWDDTGYRDEVQFLDRVEDLSSPATGRINTKGGAEYIRYLNAPEGVRPILGLRNSRADPATGTILWSERARRETSRILVAPPSWNRSAEGRLENLRLVDAGGLAASGGQAWVMWCGAGATAVPPQVNESRASIEVPVTRTTPPGLAQITWSLNRAPLETRIATQVPNAIRSDVHFTVWEESPTSVVTQARLPLRVQGGHRSANVLRVNNDVLVSGTTSELSIDGAFADTWPAPEAEIRFYDTRDVAFMRSTIGDGSRKTARANLLTWLKEEHERLVDLERDDATLIQAINDDWRWFDVWLAVTYEMRLAELSEVPSPEPQLYRSLVLDPYEDAQRAVDSAKEAVDAEKGDGVKKAQLWRKWKIAELEAEMVLCDGLDAYLAEAERQNPHMDPSRAEEIVWDAWVALINRANANQLEGDGEIRAANGYDPYLGDWEEIDFLESDTYREAIEALEGVPDSNLPLLMHAREVQSAGHSNPNAHEILAVTGAYADRTWSAYLPEEAAAYRIRVGPSKVVGRDHLAPMRQELRVQLDIGSEVAGLLDVDLKCGIVHAYPDELSQQYAGANGAHRMKEALAICKVQVNPIELWQLEDKQYAIRVAGKESAGNQPPAGDAVWIEVVLPQMTDANAKSEVASWKLHWGHVEPQFFWLQQGTGTFVRETATEHPPTEGKVRFLGGARNELQGSVKEDRGSSIVYVPITGALLEQMGINEIMSIFHLRHRELAVVARTDADAFRTPGQGSTSLLGNEATVRFVDGGPKPEIQPAQGALVGQNDHWAVGYDMSFKGSIEPDANDQPVQDSGADQAAPIIKWHDASSCVVAGESPGDTIIQIKAKFGANASPPLLEIPIQVDVPVIAQPSALQLHVARVNMNKRTKRAFDAQARLESGDFRPMDNSAEELPTPVPPANGGEDAFWRLVPGGNMEPVKSEDGSFVGAIVGGPGSPENSMTRLLDALVEADLCVLAQILPAGVEKASLAWHYPFSRNNARFPIKETQAAYGDLRLGHYRRLLHVGDGATDTMINKRLSYSGHPQAIWQRQFFHATPAGMAARKTEAWVRQTLYTELKAKRLLDHIAQLRLQRVFALRFDYLKAGVEGQPWPSHAELVRRQAVDGEEQFVPKELEHVLTAPLTLRESFWDAVLASLLQDNGPLTTLLSTPFTPEWPVGSSMTEDLLLKMISQREDWMHRIVLHLQSISGDHFVVDRSSAGAPFRGLPVDWAIEDGLLVFRVKSVNRAFFENRGGAHMDQLVNWPIDMGYRVEFQQLTDDGIGRCSHLRDIPQITCLIFDGSPITRTGRPVVGASPEAAVALRLQAEILLLRKFLDDRNSIAFFQRMRADNPLAFWTFAAGDFLFGLYDIRRAVYGEDLVSGRPLSATERMMSALVATVSAVTASVPGSATIANRGTLFLTRQASKNVAATTAQNAAGRVTAHVGDALAEAGAGWRGEVCTACDWSEGHGPVCIRSTDRGLASGY